MRNFLKLSGVFILAAFAVAMVIPLLPHADTIALGGALSSPIIYLFGIALDKTRNLPSIVVANGAATDGVRATTTTENNVRTQAYNLRVTATSDITVAGTGILNRGSVLATIPQLGFSDGGNDKYIIDARLNRFINEQFSPSVLPAVRLPTAGIATVALEEITQIMLSAPRTVNLGDTKYVETNKQSQLQVFVVPLKLITQIAQGPALVGTVTNMVVTVEQVFDQLITVAPWLTAYVRQVVQDVTGANPNLKIDLRGSRYVRGLAIQQDTNLGEVADIINSVVLRGDNASILGDQGIPFRDLQQAQAYENGGAIPAGYLLHDFCNYARLTASWNPDQDTNLRIEASVQPSVTVGVTSSRIRVAMLEYERTAVTADPMPYSI